MVIGQASQRDLSDILSLLGQHGLPLAGVREHVETMLVARAGSRIVGTAALELYGDGALLRSVAVDPAFQGQRLGHQLTEAALDLARSRGAGDVFLLTTTAEGFFPRFGFEVISRADVPSSLRQSVEFQSACPESAAVMRLRLAAPWGPVKTILFACVHNAGRSQMAAAWFNRLADQTKARAVSAGTTPGTRVHPEVVEAMREEGIDLAGAPTTRLTDALAREAHLLVTMGCGDACPHVPGALRDDWPLADPKGRPLPEVRAIRDDIRTRVRMLLESQGWAKPSV